MINFVVDLIQQHTCLSFLRIGIIQLYIRINSCNITHPVENAQSRFLGRRRQPACLIGCGGHRLLGVSRTVGYACAGIFNKGPDLTLGVCLHIQALCLCRKSNHSPAKEQCCNSADNRCGTLVFRFHKNCPLFHSNMVIIRPRHIFFKKGRFLTADIFVLGGMLIFPDGRPFSKRWVQNFFPDTQAFRSDLKKLIRIDKFQTLLQA